MYVNHVCDSISVLMGCLFLLPFNISLFYYYFFYILSFLSKSVVIIHASRALTFDEQNLNCLSGDNVQRRQITGRGTNFLFFFSCCDLWWLEWNFLLLNQVLTQKLLIRLSSPPNHKLILFELLLCWLEICITDIWLASINRAHMRSHVGGLQSTKERQGEELSNAKGRPWPPQKFWKVPL